MPLLRCQSQGRSSLARDGGFFNRHYGDFCTGADKRERPSEKWRVTRLVWRELMRFERTFTTRDRVPLPRFDPGLVDQ